MTNIAYLDQIGNKLDICRCENETQESNLQRILLSATSAWILTNVYAQGIQTSVKHIKQLAIEKLRLYQEIDPRISAINTEDMIDYVYNTLLLNGAFLHIPEYVKPASRILIGDEMCSIIRGMLPEESVKYSGLAPFCRDTPASVDIVKAFDLLDITNDKAWELIWKRSAPVTSSIQIDEYLNINRKSNEQYYSYIKPISVRRLMGRSRRNDGGYEHYLILGNEVRRIPGDFIELRIHEYARLEVMNSYNRQKVVAEFSNNTIILETRYRLPLPDLRFLRYVSWPIGTSYPNETWRFMIHSGLWSIVKTRLTQLLYDVEEKV